jgi:signal transduction histidine kinase
VPATTSAESLLRARFLRRLGHDVASATGVVSTVLDELARDGATRPELALMAKRAVRRLLRLADQLALVAELEAGPPSVERRPVELGALVEEALAEAWMADGRKDLVAACDGVGEARLVLGDARLLRTVVREVIGNALKVASSRVTVSLEAGAAATWVVRVDDDGAGFSEESRETLGRRFIERRSARGLGLSLSLAVDILRAHGGGLALGASLLPPGPSGSAGAAVLISLPCAPSES